MVAAGARRRPVQWAVPSTEYFWKKQGFYPNVTLISLNLHPGRPVSVISLHWTLKDYPTFIILQQEANMQKIYPLDFDKIFVLVIAKEKWS